MQMDVYLPTLLRDSAGGRDTLTVAGATLAEALQNLLAGHPLLRVHLYDEGGKLRRHVLLYYNGENLAWLESLDTPLRPGDRLDVVQAVSGG
ncbi:MAG TPA: MoaD/ThiS family protein [Longimicrobiaceae bacterium]|nr:MoaD/ThiS family protein [Longimicrobiaceae bacterium]